MHVSQRLKMFSAQDPLVVALQQRMQILARIPAGHAEPLQVGSSNLHVKSEGAPDCTSIVCSEVGRYRVGEYLDLKQSFLWW